MRDRVPTYARPSSGRHSSYTIDVVVFSPRGKTLAVLCQAPTVKQKASRVLPYGEPQSAESLERCARRLVRKLADVEPSWIEQVGAFGDGKRHPADAELSIGFVAVLPAGVSPDGGGEWVGLADLAMLSPRQRTIADAALSALRTRMDHAPIAFRLLPPRFTLTDLQHMYEMLLGKRLHKASFRRALQAAYLVEPTDEWRSEGRGRPAQFYAFSPRKRRNARRGVRFDSMG
ncbi:MAG: NUDIX hydrolase [Gemmatimonadaceae bacterium]